MPSLDDVARDLYAAIHDSKVKIPAPLRRELQDAFSPPGHYHSQLGEALEIILDNIDTAPVELRQLAADGGDAAASADINGMRSNGRGVGISNAMRATEGVSRRSTGGTVKSRRELRAEEDARRQADQDRANAAAAARQDAGPAAPPVPAADPAPAAGGASAPSGGAA